MNQNPRWTREELILVLELYFQLKGNIWDKNADPEIVRLSELLKSLNIHAERKLNDEFRNPNAVYTKLNGFASLDDSRSNPGLPASILARSVWNEYVQDKGKLMGDAQVIRMKFASCREALKE